MSVVTLRINDHDVSASAGETLLMVARDAGVRLPTLCHLDGVSDVGACRLCLVEVEGSSKLQAACVTKAVEGMRVRTHTPKLLAYRKMIIELLLAEGNHVCSVCVANGHCELQDRAAELGVDHVRFDYQTPKREVDVSHERYGVDHNRCILCTRCIRVCDEIEGAHTWDMSGRGHNSKVITDMNQAWVDAESCTSCGKCVQACPTGALFRHGATVAEMEKDKAKLNFLVQAREKQQWLV